MRFVFGSILNFLKIFLVYDAAELFAASGADQIFGIQLLVKANGFAAGGANDLKILVVLAVTAVTALAVAVTLKIIVPVFVLVILVHGLLVKEILNDLQIVVQLLYVLVEVVQILVEVSFGWRFT